MRKHLASAALAATMLFASAGAAGATMISIDGGTWDYGVGGKTVWSHYFHQGRRHGSTAIGKIRVDSGCVNKGLWSRATAPKKLTGNRSYYRHC